MIRFLLLWLFVATTAFSQYGTTASPCIWSGTVANCLPSAGVYLPNQRDVRYGEASGSGTNYVAIQGPTTLGGDITLTLPDNDGTSASQWLLTDASGNLSFSDTTTIAKIIDVATDTTPLTLRGDTSQTSDLFIVESTSGADSIVVNGDDEATGANVEIRGTATNVAAATGFVGEYQSSQDTTAGTCSDGTYDDFTSISLDAGDWSISGMCVVDLNGATADGDIDCFISNEPDATAGDRVLGYNHVSGARPTATTSTVQYGITPFQRLLSGSATYYLKARCQYSAGTMQVYGSISARRAR